MIDYESLEDEENHERIYHKNRVPQRFRKDRRQVPVPPAANQPLHCQDRAMERYGHDLTQDELVRIGRAVRCDRAILVQRVEETTAVYDVHVPPHILRVFYDEKHRRVITVLPPGGRIYERKET